MSCDGGQAFDPVEGIHIPIVGYSTHQPWGSYTPVSTNPTIYLQLYEVPIQTLVGSNQSRLVGC